MKLYEIKRNLMKLDSKLKSVYNILYIEIIIYLRLLSVCCQFAIRFNF